MPPTTETNLRIELSALAHNYRYLRSELAEKTRFMGVIKAFAYGSDAVKIAQKLEDLGVDYLAVAFVREAVSLRKGGITTPILVFQYLPGDARAIIDYQLMPTLFSQNSLTDFMQALENDGQTDYPVHLNFNTGMARLGFEPSEADAVIRQIKSSGRLKVDGVYSHLVASEDAGERAFSFGQIEKFKQIKEKFSSELKHKPLYHLCNTSGILNYPQAHFDMVRAGIGLFGYGNSAEADKNLRPVGTLKTLITQIHHVQKGESVGYNRQFTAKKPSKIGTLPLGYADGIHRSFGHGKTTVLINDKPAPIIGDICMDMILVDLTGIDCQENDEVVLFGTIRSAEELAGSVGTISYEILAGISQRIKRTVRE